MIHRFKQGSLYFVLDVDSGAIHVVDEIVYDVLDYYPASSALDTIKTLIDKYDEAELRAAIAEVDELIDQELLFTKEFLVVPSNVNRNVKALCLNVAHDCNMRCRYCFASQGSFGGDCLLMPLETGKAALEFLVKNSGGRRNLEVDFFGGEPLMNFGVVKELVAYGRSLEKEYNKNFRFTLTTNGLLLNDEINAFLNENMDNVVLSLDGRKEVNDFMRPVPSGASSYDIIIPKFKRLVEQRGNKTYYVRGTFTSQNVDFFDDVRHMVDTGFKTVSVEPVVTKPNEPFALTQAHVEEIGKQYEKLAEDILKDGSYSFFHFNVDFESGPCLIKRISGCGAGLDYLAVTPSGELYPCHQFVGNPEFVLGDVWNGLNENGRAKAEKMAEANALSMPKCQTCWAKFYCSGGCHANAYNMNGNLLEPYELGCQMERKRIECAIYVYAMRKLAEAEAEETHAEAMTEA